MHTYSLLNAEASESIAGFIIPRISNHVSLRPLHNTHTHTHTYRRGRGQVSTANHHHTSNVERASDGSLQAGVYLGSPAGPWKRQSRVEKGPTRKREAVRREHSDTCTSVAGVVALCVPRGAWTGVTSMFFS